jgi:hypothetical protein
MRNRLCSPACLLAFNASATFGRVFAAVPFMFKKLAP